MEPAYIDDAPDVQAHPPMVTSLRLRRPRLASELEEVLAQLYDWVMAEPVPPQLLAILRGTSRAEAYKINDLTQPEGALRG